VQKPQDYPPLYWSPLAVAVPGFRAALLPGGRPSRGPHRPDPRYVHQPPGPTGRCDEDSLLNVMRGFSFALGARCQYCHVGGDGLSFEGVDWASDEDPDKRKARFMWAMVGDLKGTLAAMPDRDTPAVDIGCKTCHRGVPKPRLLTQEMRLALAEGSIEDAVARYRELRNGFLTDGAYDFGEWEVNTLAESLVDAGRHRDAIAIYELNREGHPTSGSILSALADAYLLVGDTTTAMSRLGIWLDLEPGNERVRGRLEALRSGGQSNP